ncbi:tRNA (adenosine(37)-N6)-dimethylallyltransferase MiaA [Alkalilimnicola ehrlichii MLHE-1]
MGPTATGKTDCAVALARRLPVEIISVDSALVYRGMDIGTAKPSAALLAEVPHRLIDILDPSEAYSAARFRADALAAIHEIHAAGRVPLLAGGTMLYFRALEHGLSELPEADPALRRRLEGEAAAHGWGALHDRLAAVDPEAAARIHPHDAQRIQRALEVWELTGQSLSELQRAGRQRLPWPIGKWVLMPESRGELHRRIARRFDQMLAQGFIDEVAALRQRPDLHRALPAMRSVGYRQVWDYLDGCYDRETLRERGIAATRQFAKRQITWLRRERGVTAWLTPEQARDGLPERVGRFLSGG